MMNTPNQPPEPTSDWVSSVFTTRTSLLIIGAVIAALTPLILLGEGSDFNATLSQRDVHIGLSIFALTAFLWLSEALPLAATALLVPILASLTGIFDVKQALVAFAHPLIFIFLGGFALASAMSKQGLDRWVAHRVVAAGRGSLVASSALLFAASAFLSMWMSNTATTAMMMPLVLGVLSQVGQAKEGQSTSRIAIFLLLGVGYSASIGGLGTIVGSPPNGIAAKALGLNFQDWMAFGVPAVLVLLPCMFLTLWVVLKPEISNRIDIEHEHFEFKAPQILTLLVFAVIALSWIFSKQLGAWVGVTKYIDSLIAILAVILVLLLRLVSWRDVESNTDWGVLLLFGGGLTLSAVMKKTGASLYLANWFTDSVGGLPSIVIIAAVVAFIILLTELSSNTATAALFVPIFMAVADQLGMDSSKMVIALALAASCAFMLPVATPPNAIVFGTGFVPQKSMVRVGLVLNVVFVFVLTGLSEVLF